MVDPFYTFIAWVKLDARIVHHQTARTRLSRDLGAIDAQLQSLRHAQEEAHRNVIQAKKRVDQQELDIRTLRDREKKITIQRDPSNSPKEYTSLDAQLKNIVSDLSRYEDTLFELFQVYEDLQKAYAEQRLQAEQQEADLAQKKADLEHALQAHHHEIEKLESEYATLQPAVNPEFVELYLSKKKQIQNPVVPAHQGTCSACFYAVLAQDLVRLRKHQLVPCKQCYRLLYSEEA